MSESTGNVRLYDFRRPDKFSKDQIRTLKMIHENMARLLTTSLSTSLRTMVEVEVAQVKQESYGEFNGRLSDPTILAIASVRDQSDSTVVQIDSDIALVMVDRLFGGPGLRVDAERDLTDIEESMVRRIIARVLGALEEAWSNIAGWQPDLDSIASNPAFTQPVAPTEMVLTTTFTAQFSTLNGTLRLCLPYRTLEPLLPQLTAHRWFAREHRADTGETPAGLRRELRKTAVTMEVNLGTTAMSIADLIDLQPGSIITLDRHVDDDVHVVVGSSRKFTARPGRVGSAMAVEITGVEEGGTSHE